MKKITLCIALSVCVIFLNPAYGEDSEDSALSGSYIQQAWRAYDAGDYETAESICDKCINLFDGQARKFQASLEGPIPEDQINRYWSLNDVAIAKFIKGKIYLAAGDIEEAKAVFKDIIDNYPSAMAYDTAGWYWNVAKAADSISTELETGVDFGGSSSEYLVAKAWDTYNKGLYQYAQIYTEKCIDLYQTEAINQQNSLASYPDDSDIPDYWALNDVGVSCYISGLVSLKLGDRQKARGYFTFVKESLPYASSWDARNGTYWRVYDEVVKELKRL